MNKLQEEVIKFIRNNTPNQAIDQNFLIDESVIKKLVKAANITKKDRILEVGPGLGFLTLELARAAKEVLAIEIDERFKGYLKNLPENVKVMYGDAYKIIFQRKLGQKPNYNKSVSAIPYSQAQNMLHGYTHWFEGDLVWLAPITFAKKVNEEPILGAYFKAEVLEEVPKTAFLPEPKTTSAIIYFKRIQDPKVSKDFEIFLRRYFYDHEELKFKNVLREGIIKAVYELKGNRMTKRETRMLIENLKLPVEQLEKLTSNIRPEYYFEIPKNLEGWFKKI